MKTNSSPWCSFSKTHAAGLNSNICSQYSFGQILHLSHLWSFVRATEQYKSINCIMFLIRWLLPNLKECTWQVKLSWSTVHRGGKKKNGVFLSLKFPAFPWEKIVRLNIEHYVVPQAHLNNFTLKRITEDMRSTPKSQVLLKDQLCLKQEFLYRIWEKMRTKQSHNIPPKCPPRFQLLVGHQFPHIQIIPSI